MKMECTQRLDFECSQIETIERTCPEQIGFLGILGSKYPVKRGPNKIGRDPNTCSIVLNLNSISRQHAVINVLNGGQYMLMDLDSANRTRLNNKSLQAYVPEPMLDGDTVQFGDIFGVFRLLEDAAGLPSTQALDLPATQRLPSPAPAPCPAPAPAPAVPDTPLPRRPPARLRHATVPESPDVSDKDDSFIMPSQPKADRPFSSPSDKFVKPSSRTIVIQPLGSNKIDNIYWNSSKKSNSFNLDDSVGSVNDSNANKGDELSIHEMETQVPYNNESTDSIYTAATQIPPECSPNINTAATQLPIPEHLPAVQRINDQHELEIDLFAANKENELSIHNADTQLQTAVNTKHREDIFTAATQLPFDSPPVESISKPDNIYTANTQLPFDCPPDKHQTNIFNANTQLPGESSDNSKHVENDSTSTKLKKSKENIHDANTQVLSEKPATPKNNDIFNAYTQIPFDDDNSETTSDKCSIFTADTQMPAPQEQVNVSIEIKKDTSINNTKSTINKSDDTVLFDEIEQPLLDGFDSQPIVTFEPNANQENEEEIPLSQSDTITEDDFLTKSEENSEVILQPKSAKRNLRIRSDSSTDCEDIEMMSTQKIPALPKNEDDTDCEDDVLGSDVPLKANVDVCNSNINLEDLPTQVIVEDVVDGNIGDSVEPDKNNSKPIDIEDMPTQVITEVDDIEDMATQVLIEDVPDKETVQKFSQEMMSPFKIPLQSPRKIKRKDIQKSSDPTVKKSSPVVAPVESNKRVHEKYYAATQEIFEDLCSQRNDDTVSNAADLKTINNNLLKDKAGELNDEIVPSSVENFIVGPKCPHLEVNVTPTKKYVQDRSSGSSDEERKVKKYVSNLSSKQLSDVIGAEVAAARRAPSDPSDVEMTPKKVRPFKFLQTVLPDSQEIKTSVSLSTKSAVTESSSESEVENDSQEATPILFRKKRAKVANVKQELSAKFDVHALPTRIITRTRKPTAKAQESEGGTRKRTRNILKSKLLTDQDDDVDTEIISENITRLRNKTEKKNNKVVSSNSAKLEIKSKDVKSETTTDRRTQNRTKNDDNTIDLTKTEEIIERHKRKPRETKHVNTSKSKKENDKDKEKSTTSTVEEVITLDEEDPPATTASRHKPRETRKRPQKTDSQNKITNYTISKTEKPQPSTATKKDGIIDLINETNNTRKTRSKSNSNEKKSVSPERDTSKRRRGRPRKDETESDSKRDDKEKDKKEDSDKKRQKRDVKPDEEETRRSGRIQTNTRRQRTTKSDSQPATVTHEQSTVYSMSSESDSPKAVKRAAAEEADVPSPKRTRAAVQRALAASELRGSAAVETRGSAAVETRGSAAVETRGSAAVETRGSAAVETRGSAAVEPRDSVTPAQASSTKTHYVLLTAFPSEEVKTVLEKLGAVIVSDVLQCTVVLTLCVRRTFKLLCGVGLGRPVVGGAWVQACVDAGAIQDPWQYLLEDKANEQRFQFSLSRTLRGPRGYLRGCSVSATPSVLPSAPEMKLIVECSGGRWGAGGPRWLAVSCAADRARWAALRAQGARLVSSELILAGVLTQQLDVDRYALH